ncbi:hypothetical protein RD792_012007 [Penstemon davidsonii]|uniref:Beta-galactosidase n=1 Tax=Penstemon davidsonii TaxID=160366 RepID=A0ABR0CW57_9LAMI|nr:hypothetical protein RD792_012007 [Penstemon davidsonii]
MKNFTNVIVDMVKQAKLFAPQGGPIILAQIENEYGNIISSYGEDGKSYINWCANFAESLNVGVPWIMCQESDAPSSMINTCNGFYCDQFWPSGQNMPKFWTENWSGWFKTWGGHDPHRSAEDLAFSVARFYQYGGTLQNYYMYHGGTNIGRAAGGPYITTSYDYDAPLNEYGKSYIVPSWSVSILPDCAPEVYNTAKNYGAFIDRTPTGILGPVKLIAPNNVENDLSTNEWAYKVGLDGMVRGLGSVTNKEKKRYKWRGNIPVNQMFVWYKMWPDLIRKSKEGGLNAIETYVFWNAHEPLYRQYDFSGNLNLMKFLKLIQDEGLYAILRIGPYVCAEWNYGGFPVWLNSIPNMTFRTKNDAFMNEMKNFTNLIVDMVKQEQLFASEGGPIILAQIENEYGNVISSYGNNGKSYINWCANFAESLSIGVPWIMCQESDAPPSIINTCNGYYCDQFWPNNQNIPKMWTENWSGWYKDWGGQDPHRTAEDLAFAVGRFYQYGGTLQNYYMYHGGTNFGRVAGGPYITTSYDYDAPLDEYGNLNQPKWGHLKKLHSLIMSMEKVLTYGEVNNTDYGRMMSSTVFSYNGTRVCFFGNANNQDERGERVTLQVNCTCHVLHAFFNGKQIGSQWVRNGQYSFVFERDAKLKQGTNTISLLSVTVGLQNYGAFFDKTPNGILGPVKLIAPNSVEKDLSSNEWAYKVGLNGLEKGLENIDIEGKKHKWHSHIPINRMLVWYKTNFRTPKGKDPVVLDLYGSGKGMAWVNGHDIGRYWPSFISDENGCSSSCDYRGAYYASKCLTNCGKSSQRCCGFIGVGIIARNSYGACISWRAIKINLPYDPETAEAQAAVQALHLGKENGWLHIIIEGDCKTVIDSINENKSSLGKIGPLLEEIYWLKSGFQEIPFSHTFREGNLAAHALARLACSSSVIKDVLPFDIIDIVTSDSIG